MQLYGLDELIAAHPFFRGLPADTCRMIAGCGRNVHFAAGERIFRSGDPADAFYVIRHGSVALEFSGPRGPVVFETLHENEILNTVWLVPPYRCRSDARALEPVRAIALDAVCLRGKCDADHDLGYELMKRFVPMLLERLDHARVQAADLYGASGT
jgi:CRP/FNR family cyclic AMP-dependent transcriptional regulator